MVKPKEKDDKRKEVVADKIEITFHLPRDLAIALKKRAADDSVRFSDIAAAAVRMYLGIKEDEEKK